MRLLIPLFALCAVLSAQTQTVFEGLPALDFSNDKLLLTLLPEGGAMVQLLLRDDPEKMSPLWNPLRFARESGRKAPNNMFRGHFVCVDGFGPPSEEEKAAGLPMHGEAHTLPWQIVSSGKQGNTSMTRFSVTLPLSHEILTRTIRLVDGENVIWVDSELENLLAFDRPVFWGEHATIGSPFLEAGKTVVDMPATRSRTRSYPTPTPRFQLIQGRDFTWPLAPAKDGGTIDLRAAPLEAGSGGHTTNLMDPGRKLGFVTALHPGKRLLLGWVFPREEYPWVQDWESYPSNTTLARGMEFATQPFDLPRREALQIGEMFNTPAFRILPAKSKISTRFLIFYTRTPDGFEQVDDIRLENGRLVIEDRRRAKQVILAAARTL